MASDSARLMSCIMCLFLPGLIFLPFSLYYHIQAEKDPRSDKLKIYNGKVEAWDGEYGGVKYEEWNSLARSANFPNTAESITITGINGEYSKPVFYTEEDLGKVAVPDLANDEYGKRDIYNYEEGLVLKSVTPNAHIVGRDTPDTISIDITSTLMATATKTIDFTGYECKYRKWWTRDCNEDVPRDKDSCNTKYEYVESTRSWAKDVTLVAKRSDDDVIDFEIPNCSPSYKIDNLRFKSRPGGRISEEEENLAKKFCDNSAPPENVDFTLQIRSEDDPWVTAGKVTQCRYDFGASADEYRSNAKLLFWVGVVCLVPALLLCLFFGGAEFFVRGVSLCFPNEKKEKVEPKNSGTKGPFVELQDRV